MHFIDLSYSKKSRRTTDSIINLIQGGTEKMMRNHAILFDWFDSSILDLLSDLPREMYCKQKQPRNNKIVGSNWPSTSEDYYSRHSIKLMKEEIIFYFLWQPSGSLLSSVNKFEGIVQLESHNSIETSMVVTLKWDNFYDLIDHRKEKQKIVLRVARMGINQAGNNYSLEFTRRLITKWISNSAAEIRKRISGISNKLTTTCLIWLHLGVHKKVLLLSMIN